MITDAKSPYKIYPYHHHHHHHHHHQHNYRCSLALRGVVDCTMVVDSVRMLSARRPNSSHFWDWAFSSSDFWYSVCFNRWSREAISARSSTRLRSFSSICVRKEMVRYMWRLFLVNENVKKKVLIQKTEKCLDT